MQINSWKRNSFLTKILIIIALHIERVIFNTASKDNQEWHRL